MGAGGAASKAGSFDSNSWETASFCAADILSNDTFASKSKALGAFK
jgi:hypothetical protein